MKYILNTFFYLTLIVTSTVYAASNSSVDKNQTPPIDFEGKMLVSVSDADMVGSAYVDGKLGPREGHDAISIIPLGKPIRELQAHETEVSNSVAGPAITVTVTPDGHYALVVESFKARTEGPWEKQSFSDLPVGNVITVVDLSIPLTSVSPDHMRASGDNLCSGAALLNLAAKASSALSSSIL